MKIVGRAVKTGYKQEMEIAEVLEFVPSKYEQTKLIWEGAFEEPKPKAQALNQDLLKAIESIKRSMEGSQTGPAFKYLEQPKDTNYSKLPNAPDPPKSE